MRNVLTRTPVGTRLFIEQSCLFDLSEKIWWNKVVKVIHICFSCSMLCTDGLLLHLVGKRQLLVYSGVSYGNGKLGDSIWESHRKSSAQGARRANTPPQAPEMEAKRKRTPALKEQLAEQAAKGIAHLGC